MGKPILRQPRAPRPPHEGETPRERLQNLLDWFAWRGEACTSPIAYCELAPGMVAYENEFLLVKRIVARSGDFTEVIAHDDRAVALRGRWIRVVMDFDGTAPLVLPDGASRPAKTWVN